MRRVSLGITVYLIWEERNKRVFDGKTSGVDTVFRRFQILFYIVFHFYEKGSFPSARRLIVSAWVVCGL